MVNKDNFNNYYTVTGWKCRKAHMISYEKY